MKRERLLIDPLNAIGPESVLRNLTIVRSGSTGCRELSVSRKIKTFLEKLPVDTIHRLTVQLVLCNRLRAPIETDDDRLIDQLTLAFVSVKDALPFLDAADLDHWSESPQTDCFDPSIMLHILTLPESAFRYQGWHDLESDLHDGESEIAPEPVRAPTKVLYGTQLSRRSLLCLAAAALVVAPALYLALAETKPHAAPLVATTSETVPSPASPTPLQAQAPAPVSPQPKATLNYAAWEAEVTSHIKAAAVRSNILVTGTNGTAIVKFVVDSGGRMTGVHLAQPSGNPMLDRKALTAVSQAAPVSPPLYPNLALTVPFEFRG